MMNRKRTADDASLDEVKEFDDKPGTSSRTASRPMQGDGEDGNKHTIDSDEEEDFTKKAEEYDVLDDEEIEGQEDSSKVDKVRLFRALTCRICNYVVSNLACCIRQEVIRKYEITK